MATANTISTIYKPNRTALTYEGQNDDPDQVLAEAERAGVNIAALKHNLTLSPDERIDKFLKAWAWLQWAKEARRYES